MPKQTYKSKRTKITKEEYQLIKKALQNRTNEQTVSGVAEFFHRSYDVARAIDKSKNYSEYPAVLKRYKVFKQPVAQTLPGINETPKKITISVKKTEPPKENKSNAGMEKALWVFNYQDKRMADALTQIAADLMDRAYNLDVSDFDAEIEQEVKRRTSNWRYLDMGAAFVMGILLTYFLTIIKI